ncbi:amino acid adenylation domain-containing protein [Streptomyces sp. NPDC088251]|uniref:amino acid adenylation domain-containing protein n=1 Tax=unclassified Streptomyces TaxID=2593676 RepID=UPI0038270370
MAEPLGGTPAAELTMSAPSITEAAGRALSRPGGQVRTLLLVSDVVAAEARRDPDRTALLAVGGDVTTYGQLHTWVRRLRGLLLDHGCGEGDRIAVAGPRGTAGAVAFLALESIGAVYVPVDPAWPADRLRQIFVQTGCALVLTHTGDGEGDGRPPAGLVQAAAQSGTGLLASVDAVHRVPCPEREEAWQGGECQPRYIIYTSGSSGHPKGVIIEHRAMVNHFRHMIDELGITRADVVAFNSPPTYVVSVWQMLAPLLAGAGVAVFSDAHASYPRRMLHALRTTEVTVVQLVPALIEPVISELRRREPTDRLPALRWLISTGEELRPQLARQVLEALPATRLMNAYGMSECSDDVAQHVVRPEDLHLPRLPVGRPVTNAVLHVLVEEEAGWRAALDGETGELFVGGLPVGIGYVAPAPASGAVFLRDLIDPLSPTQRLYRTGDRAQVADGIVYCLGRADRQVKIRGTRIELDEIERVLSRHPDVSHCAVTVEASGESRSLKAHVVTARNTPARDLQSFLRERLPAAMLPRSWASIVSMPLTRSGKTDYHALLSGAPLTATEERGTAV